MTTRILSRETRWKRTNRSVANDMAREYRRDDLCFALCAVVGNYDLIIWRNFVRNVKRDDLIELLGNLKTQPFARRLQHTLRAAYICERLARLRDRETRRRLQEEVLEWGRAA